MVAAVAIEAPRGAIYNLAPARTDPMALWIQRILGATGSNAELVRVPDETALAEELGLTKAFSQPVVFSSSRARQDLGYRDTDPNEAVARSVHWHLEHPPAETQADFARDDQALATADRR